ncbi:hypothetical protein FSP39_014614 [Pinctada imbricata]|uniref:Uncharacterized protein n=1 Tax=Pinctada imbricata TaxID=66713 RepID=A0AA88XFS9_PINIB|nr:hypothetical protein FSP39_014614 [Pinctada imbricata]
MAERQIDVVEKTGAKMLHILLGPFHPIIWLCHPDSAKELMKSTEPKPVFKPPGGYYFYKEWLGMGLLLSHGKKWERNRRLLTPAFHFDILKPYVNIYNKVADTLLENIKQNMDSKNEVEIYNLVSMATLDTMLRCAFSYTSDVQTNRNPLVHSDFIFYRTISGRRVRKEYDYVHHFAEELISLRRKSLEENSEQLKKRQLDFLDILITARDEDGTGLSDEEIRAEVDTFMFAGHDTTASSISWALYYLAKYPEEQQKVYEEVRTLTDGKEIFTWENIAEGKQMRLFLKESMRHASPAPMFSRLLTKPYVCEGVEIPAGTEIIVLTHLFHIQPDIWSDYKEFRPERFLDDESKKRDPYAYVPFSAGPRYKLSLVPGFEYVKEHLAVTRAKNGIKLHVEERT